MRERERRRQQTEIERWGQTLKQREKREGQIMERVGGGREREREMEGLGESSWGAGGGERERWETTSKRESMERKFRVRGLRGRERERGGRIRGREREIEMVRGPRDGRLREKKKKAQGQVARAKSSTRKPLSREM